MNDLIHADIFFFISSISVVIITIVFCILGFYVFSIVRDVKYISNKLRDVTDELEENFDNLKKQVSDGGRKAKYLLEFFLNRFSKKKKK